MDLGSQILQYVLSGLVLGGIYALIAVGFVTIYNVTGILNLAQGEFVMLGALLSVTLVKLQVPLFLAVVMSVLAVSLVGTLMERSAIYPARQASVITLIIITIGVGIALRGVALIIWGTESYTLPPFSKGPPVFILGAVLVPQAFWVLGITLLMVIAMYLFFDRTLVGIALKACMVNRLAARLMGISPSVMSCLSFTLSAGLGAIAGIAIAPITMATYHMGLMLGLKGFVAAVLGGLTSAPGAVAGGLLLGVMESLGAGLVSSGYKDAFAFLILLVVLLARHGGTAGGTTRV